MRTETPTTKPKITIKDIAKFNPLIDENGDTSKVSAVLDFVVWAAYSDDGSATVGASPMYGLGAILETCSTALKEML